MVARRGSPRAGGAPAQADGSAGRGGLGRRRCRGEARAVDGLRGRRFSPLLRAHLARAGAASPMANGQPEEMLDAPPAEEHPEDAPTRAGMPVLAGALADVLGGDPDPVVALGLGDHRLEQPAVGLLDLARADPARPAPRGVATASASRTRSSSADAQHPRAAHGGHAPLDPGARERGGEQLAQSLLEQRRSAGEARDVPGDRRAGPRTCGAADSATRTGSSNEPDRLDLKQFLGHEAPPSALDGPGQSTPPQLRNPPLRSRCR